jgi:hypothetical protein
MKYVLLCVIIFGINGLTCNQEMIIISWSTDENILTPEKLSDSSIIRMCTRSEYTSHDPIVISEDSQFIAFNGVTGGDGSVHTAR